MTLSRPSDLYVILMLQLQSSLPLRMPAITTMPIRQPQWKSMRTFRRFAIEKIRLTVTRLMSLRKELIRRHFFMLASRATLRSDCMGRWTIHQFIPPRAVFSGIQRDLVLAVDAVRHCLWLVLQGTWFAAAGKHLAYYYELLLGDKLFIQTLFQNIISILIKKILYICQNLQSFGIEI